MIMLKSCKKHEPKAQRGMALITVLLVFFIASLLTISMIDRQQIDIHRTENLVDQIQLKLNILAGESYANSLLWEDYNSDNSSQGRGIDTLDETWNELIKLELEKGGVQLQITDLQSVFNVNWVIKSNVNNPLIQQAFIKLMQEIGLSNPQLVSEELSGTLQEHGALFSKTELLSLESLSIEDYQLLTECISTLPIESHLNLNTASETILKSWADTIVPNQRDDLILERQRNQGIIELPSLPGDLTNFSINSEYFQVNINADFQDKNIFVKSVLFRDNETGEIELIKRSIEQIKFSKLNEDENACKAN